jgi:hypothetical protein
VFLKVVFEYHNRQAVMMGAEMVPEKSAVFKQPTHLIAQENFITMLTVISETKHRG